MSRGYDWEASFGGCATGTTDKNDEFRPKNAVFRFKLKEINFEAVQTCIVEEFLFGDFKARNPAQTKLAWPQYEHATSSNNMGDDDDLDQDSLVESVEEEVILEVKA